MGAGDESPYVKARKDWDIPDPKNMNGQDFNEVRNLIGKKVLFFINEIAEKLTAG